MRFFLAATIAAIAIGAATGQAGATCSCLCVNGKAESRCTTKSEIVPVCPASTCRVGMPSATLAPVNAAPYSPAEITTTVPPSITNPESASPTPFPPSSVAPRGRVEAPVEPVPAVRSRGGQAQTTTPNSTGPLSITRPDIPTTIPRNGASLCYQRQVFNPNTYEYEWQEACD